MATIKVSEASGPVLDWLVMKIEFDRYAAQGDPIKSWVSERHSKGDPCGQPSTDWAQGGPIIHRELISTWPYLLYGVTESGSETRVRAGWVANYEPKTYWMFTKFFHGPTPLVAAMRCYVASKLGDTAEVPDELLRKS